MLILTKIIKWGAYIYIGTWLNISRHKIYIHDWWKLQNCLIIFILLSNYNTHGNDLITFVTIKANGSLKTCSMNHLGYNISGMDDHPCMKPNGL